MSNENRRAVVTGTSSGIGLAIASHLLEAGWQVQGLDSAPAQIDDARFVPVAVDLTEASATEAAAQAARGANAFVHAAGVLRVGNLGHLDADAGRMMWQLHVDAATRIAGILLPAMQAGDGVVLIGSRVWRGIAGRSQYAATKAAVVSLARSWAAESIQRGVTVNVVSPAATETAMLQDPARQSAAPQLPPLGRLIRPQEIAALVGYLLSPAAAAITGQDIQICGGASLR